MIISLLNFPVWWKEKCLELCSMGGRETNSNQNLMKRKFLFYSLQKIKSCKFKNCIIPQTRIFVERQKYFGLIEKWTKIDLNLDYITRFPYFCEEKIISKVFAFSEIKRKLLGAEKNIPRRGGQVGCERKVLHLARLVRVQTKFSELK